MPLTVLSEETSLLSQILAELRNQKLQKDRHRFRWNLKRAGFIIAYEISRRLSYMPAEVTTPLAQAQVYVLAEPPVLISILRAGNAFLEGAMEAFDFADVGFVAARRTELTNREVQVEVDYLAVPPLEGRSIILIDPMLATGRSILLSYEALLLRGRPKAVFVMALIASEFGVKAVQKQLPQAHLYVGAVDKELTAKAYIVPGLGDAGDLAYGPLHA
ncbi:MAG: uracil phosphoribosyltransferase [Bacteroidia bacterium]|nr:uracil phosphoribosyltransferase [Bacteroidia bacterium]MCX7764915.1 uracil phosphoribosyltransferase [Bacteroidia bacterium]MDW8057531.1 uracil phosphoribosyltransferase [Bacteroidia bacterium]